MTTTKAEQLLVSTGYDLFGSNDDVKKIMEAMKQAMEIGYDSGVKMSAISKDALLKQYFEDTFNIEDE